VKLLLQVLLVFLCIATGVWAKMTPEQVAKLPAPAPQPVDFVTEIKPILEARCINCHGRGRDKGGFQIDTRETLLKGGSSGPAVIAGKSQESLLIELVMGVDPDNVMPLKGSRLTTEQIGLLRGWIDQGLPWDQNVNFARRTPLNLKPQPGKLLLVTKNGANPIDQLLKSYLATNEVPLQATVADSVYARRVFLDIVGLLPSPDELSAFLSDPSPDKRERLATKLLGDNRRYAEHWLAFWNDLLRNDYRGTGYIDGGRKQITPWLFSALLTNMPYDRFVAQLVNPTEESAGFAKGIVWRGVVNASQTPEMQAAQNISQVFMGVNLKCASCHDSFINDWRLSEAYGLASVYHEGPLEQYQCDKPTGKMATAAFIYPELGEIDTKVGRPERLQRLAEIITGKEDGRLPRTIVNRLWARLFGRGLVEPLDEMEQPAWNPDLLDWLAEDLVAHGYDLKQTIARMVTSAAYQMPAVNLSEAVAKAYVFRGPTVRRLSAEQLRDAVGQLTQVWFDKGDFRPDTNGPVRASFVATDPLMTALGRPNREQVVTSRADTATTLQALELTNGETLARVLGRGAEKIVANAPNPADLIPKVFKGALGRDPTTTERVAAAELLGSTLQKESVEDLLWSLTMLPEFQLIY
jgi:mono/diheme cytochrome c family protein